MSKPLQVALFSCVVALIAAAALPAEGVPMFELTGNHLALLRQSIVVWAPIESGVPAVLPSPQLMSDESGPDLYLDLARRSGLKISDPPSAEQRGRLDTLMQDLPEALAQILAHGRLVPGSYDYRNPLATLPAAGNLVPEERRDLAGQPVVTFAFTARHALLLRNSRWQELFMNAKRPYGDRTYFELDMAEILGEPLARGDDGMLPAAEGRRLWNLHVETLPALQLFLQRAEIAPGSCERITPAK